MSPYRMALLMACAIFACELAVMAVLYTLPDIPYAVESFIDSTILITFLVPFYFGLYRPFWKEHKRIEAENRTLSRQLLENVEEERKRVSHDLHDQCGQTLTSIRLGVEVVQRTLPTEEDMQRQRLQAVLDMISQLNNELREIVYQLRPPMLDRIGLVSALEDLVSEIRRLHPELSIIEDYAFGKQGEKLPQENEVAFYRVCQESLHNVLKYAQASHVFVTLKKKGDQVLLIVQDNGVGFVEVTSVDNTKKRRGVGLFGMRERISALNGEFDVVSVPGGGTTVMALLPGVGS